jgi:hypothetical protein
MAIDTATKRASTLSFGLIALALVVPSGIVDQQARQTIANTYNGILAGEAVVVVATGRSVNITMTPDNRTIEMPPDNRTIKLQANSRRITFI